MYRFLAHIKYQAQVQLTRGTGTLSLNCFVSLLNEIFIFVSISNVFFYYFIELLNM